MIQATTPEFTLTIENVDLTEADEVIVSIKQKCAQVEITDPDIVVTVVDRVTVSTLTFALTQEQTLLFSVGNAKLQVNWLKDDYRGATNTVTIGITENLIAGVLENES